MVRTKEFSEKICTYGMVILGVVMAILALLLPVPEIGLSVVIIFCLLIIFVKLDLIATAFKNLINQKKEQ
jgi:tellurite resistance protein TehA-like permease